MATNFTYVKKGYNPIEVDNYIETLENVIKSYKEKDAAIKNAIINAQIAADNIVSDAQKRADDLSLQALRKVDVIRNSIEKQKTFVKAFQDDYNNLIKKYVQEFNDKDILPVYTSIDNLEMYLLSLSSEKDQLEDIRNKDSVTQVYNIVDPDSKTTTVTTTVTTTPTTSTTSGDVENPAPEPPKEIKGSASLNNDREAFAELLK